MELQLPIPTIDSAVEMRDMSSFKDERKNASKQLTGPKPKFSGDANKFIKQLHNAFYFGMIASYAQGMALLRLASDKYEYNLNLHDVAKIWRGGCIIRSTFLEAISSAYLVNPKLVNLMVDPEISRRLINMQADLRFVVACGIEWGIPVSGLSSSLAYYDSYRSEWLPANLIQAQRDYFGSHTYERIDMEGTFHTQWNESEGD